MQNKYMIYMSCPCTFYKYVLQHLIQGGEILTMGEKKNGLAIAGLVLRITAITLSFIPLINILSFIIGLLALIFSIISLAQKRSPMRIVALMLGVLSLVSCVYVNNLFVRSISNNLNRNSNSTNDADNDLSGLSHGAEEKQYVNVGEVIKTKDWEITIDSAQFSQKVEAPQSSGYFRNYYQVDDSDNTYLYVVLNCKNISTLDIIADEIASVNVKYKEDYQYSSFSTILDGQSGFTYTNITSIKPLTSDKIYYLSEMPKSVEGDISSPIEIYIKVNGETFIYKYR